ncbi:MAG: hypothetical protein KAS32_11035 [Candidatus Peribacteraceae bacterium]|nr:hypothetical protein [Candidatus Peribacteraceae bacterium]
MDNTIHMAEEDNTLSEQIEEIAKGPQEITTAGVGHSKEFDLDDLILAAKFNPPSTVKRRVGGGMRFTQATPSGSA